MFNVDEFLTSSNNEVLDSKFNQLQAGEYDAQIGVDDKAIEITTGESDDKENPGQKRPWAQMAIRFEVLDPTGEIEKNLGRKPGMTYRFFLDLKSDGRPDWAPQRNVRMGQILKATGQDKPGWKVTDIKGKRCKIKVANVKQKDGTARAEVVMVGDGN
jgi:hypothetical protein